MRLLIYAGLRPRQVFPVFQQHKNQDISFVLDVHRLLKQILILGIISFEGFRILLLDRKSSEMKSSPEMSPAQDLACQWGDCTESFMEPTDLYVCYRTSCN